MTTVRFLFDNTSMTVVVPADRAKEAPTLLAIARENNLPLLANCEAGACGACLVDVKNVSGTALAMSEAEAFFLFARAQLGADLEEDADGRLACQYRLSEDEEIEVRFTSVIGYL